MKTMMKLTVFLVLLVWSAPAAALDVVTTIPDLAAIARAVGGEEVDVTALARPNEDPHYVDPRPNLILKLNKADVLVSVGLELEDAWLEPLVKQARNRAILPGGKGRLVSSDHVELLGAPTGKLDRAHGDVHPGGNPHFYFDPRRAAKIAVAMRDLFKELEPSKASTFEKNARAFLTENQKLIIGQRNLFLRLPAEKRKIVTYHRSLEYLLDWLALEEIATVEPRPGIPPNPAHVAKVLKTMKSNGVDVIIQEEFYPQQTSKTLAKLAKGQVAVIEGGTRFDQGESYIEHMQKITEELYEALSD